MKHTACRLTNVCSAEALAAAPAAKEVDAEKNNNGVVDACDGGGKKATAAGAPKSSFSIKKPAAENGQFYVSAFVFSDDFRAPGRRGPFRAAAKRGAETTARQTWASGRLKRAPANAGGVRASAPADFVLLLKTIVLVRKREVAGQSSASFGE